MAAKRLSMHWLQQPQCHPTDLLFLVREQEHELLIRSPAPASIIRLTTSVFVMQIYGFSTANDLPNTSAESSWSIWSVIGCVVRDARARSTWSAIGRFKLTTPFSKNVMPSALT